MKFFTNKLRGVLLLLGTSALSSMDKLPIIEAPLIKERVPRELISLISSYEQALSDYKPYKTIPARYASSLAFSTNGKTVLTGLMDTTALLWNVHSGNQIQVFQGHTGPVLSVAFSPDGKTVLTGSQDKTARLWDVNTGELLKVFKGHTDIVTSVTFSPDGNYVLTGSWDKTIRLWNIHTGKELKQFEHTG